MGIVFQSTVDYRDDFGMMNSDDPTFEAYEEIQSQLLSKHRRRSSATSNVEPQAKKLKKRE